MHRHQEVFWAWLESIVEEDKKDVRDHIDYGFPDDDGDEDPEDGQPSEDLPEEDEDDSEEDDRYRRKKRKGGGPDDPDDPDDDPDWDGGGNAPHRKGKEHETKPPKVKEAESVKVAIFLSPQRSGTGQQR